MATMTVTGPAGGQQNSVPLSSQVGYFANARKHQRMDSSLLPGFLLLLGSSVHISWSFWSLILIWLNGTMFGPSFLDARLTIVMTTTAWFVGALNGSLIAGYVLRNLPNKLANYVGALVLFISGIFFVSGFMSLTAMNVGRLLAGCCNGMIHIGVLKQIGDNAPASYRGSITAKISLLSALAALLSCLILIIGAVSHPLNLDQIIGFVTLGFALASAITTRFSKYDSVVQLIEEGREREAIDMLIKLRKEPHETWTLRNEYDELKAMVSEKNVEAQTIPKHIFSGGNQSVLKLIVELKLLNLLATNYVLHFISVALLANAVNMFLALAIYPSIRIFALIEPLTLVDKSGRRHLLLISVVCTGLTLLAMGIEGMLAGFKIVHAPNMLWIIGITGCLVQLFASVGLEPIQNIYTAEAFPLAKRTVSLIFVNCIEHLVHIIMIVTFVTLSFVQMTYLITIFIYAFALIIGGVCVFKRLPETRGMTLRQCHNQFNKHRLPIAPNAKPGISSIGIAYA